NTPSSPLPSSLHLAPAPTPTSTLSLHDALPISLREWLKGVQEEKPDFPFHWVAAYVHTELGERDAALAFLPKLRDETSWYGDARDRKSTRLNSSHLVISYAVFCLKKKKDHLSDTDFTVRQGLPRLKRLIHGLYLPLT